MSWIITGSFAQPDEPEALTYIAAVEAADGEALEDGVKFAYNSFIKGCKADGIWNAIKASCILAGARTLAGALVPLVGAAPTNNNFVAGDYDRETGLVGDGSTKYLDSNRNNNADPQNSNHNAVYIGQVPVSASGSQFFAGVGPITNEAGANNIAYTFNAPARYAFRNRTSNSADENTAIATGFIGTSRDNSISYIRRFLGSSSNVAIASQTPRNANVIIFATENGNFKTSARLAFYSIGEFLDLAALDTRVTTLMSDLAAAIP